MKAKSFFRAAALLLLLLSTLSGCIRSPKAAYSQDELGKLDELTEMMHVFYFETKSIWPLEKKEELGDADWALLTFAGGRVEAAATALVEKIGPQRPEGFRKLAGTLGTEGGKLVKARLAKNRADANAAIKAMGDTCEACHKEFK